MTISTPKFWIAPGTCIGCGEGKVVSSALRTSPQCVSSQPAHLVLALLQLSLAACEDPTRAVGRDGVLETRRQHVVSPGGRPGALPTRRRRCRPCIIAIRRELSGAGVVQVLVGGWILKELVDREELSAGLGSERVRGERDGSSATDSTSRVDAGVHGRRDGAGAAEGTARWRSGVVWRVEDAPNRVQP